MKKHIGKILIIALSLIAVVFMLYPTYRTAELEEKKEKTLAKAETARDSLDRLEAYNKEYGDALADAKGNSLKLGLDLRGGMYVTLEVDVIKLIEESAQSEAIDDVFMQVIDKTKEDAKDGDEDVMDIFLENFDQIAREQYGKTLMNYFDVGDYREASEEKIVEKLRDNSASAIDQAKEVLTQRVDKYGIAESTVQKQGNRRIMMELPGVKDEQEMRNLLETTARLEFKLVKNTADIVRLFAKIDRVLSEREKKTEAMKGDTSLAETSATITESDTAAIAQTDTAAVDTAASDTSKSWADTAKAPEDPYADMSDEEKREQYQKDHPFTTLFQTFYMQESPDGKSVRPTEVGYMVEDFPDGNYSFRIFHDNLPRFWEILSRPEIKALIPYDRELVRDAKPIEEFTKQDENAKFYNFYALKKESELTGDVITDAHATFDPTTNQPIVQMNMNTEGAERWASITGANIGKQIAIVLDGQVYSAPRVINKIPSGSSQITGMSSIEEARILEIVLKAGALKAPVEIIEERVVGPSLGEDSIASGWTASIIAIILVIVFMLLYYLTAGAIADFAVILNVLLVLSFLATLGGTLTLPGIAGIILTIGMAVDANILIFERIREERAKGRSMRSSIDEGFGKALSAILDTNITTFITAMILYFVGTGPIQGFALTLMIGILATLFTAIVITRSVFELILASGADKINLGEKKVVNA